MITRMLLASVLAIGAGSFAAGCGNTDCPGSITGTESCSTEGLTCTPPGQETCTCSNGKWLCTDGDLPMPLLRDMSMRDLASSHD